MSNSSSFGQATSWAKRVWPDQRADASLPPLLLRKRAFDDTTTQSRIPSLPSIASSKLDDVPIRPVLPRYDYHTASPLKHEWKQTSKDSEAANTLSRFGHLSQLDPSPPPSWSRDDKPEPSKKSPRMPRARTQKRREQCRNNQARYRLRQTLRLQNMENEAARMREEIVLLQVLNDGWQEGCDSVSRAVGMGTYIVDEFFRRFRNGLSGASIHLPVFPLPTVSDLLAVTPTRAFSFKSECNATYVKQVAFLRTVIAPDATIGDELFGPDAVLEQWWRYSCYFKRVYLALDRIKVMPRNDETHNERVIAHGRITVKINSTTMERVFPHLTPGGVLSNALIDRMMSFPIRMQFEFSNDWGNLYRISRMAVDIDMLQDVLRVVETPQNVATVLGGARISPSGYIGSLVNHPVGDSSRE